MSAQGVVIHKSYNPAENVGKQLRTLENIYHLISSWEQLRTRHRYFSSVWRGFQHSDRKVVRSGGLGWGWIGYLRPDQFLDHLTEVKTLIQMQFNKPWRRFDQLRLAAIPPSSPSVKKDLMPAHYLKLNLLKGWWVSVLVQMYICSLKLASEIKSAKAVWVATPAPTHHSQTPRTYLYWRWRWPPPPPCQWTPPRPCRRPPRAYPNLWWNFIMMGAHHMMITNLMMDIHHISKNVLETHTYDDRPS